MAKLNQIIAIEQSIKNKSFEALTQAHQKLQKQELLMGISRTYTPKTEDGDKLPPESKNVQLSASTVIDEIAEGLVKWLDITACKDYTNTEAKADVKVNGTTIATGVPTTYLLFLEKKLVDLHTFVEKLPRLDPAEEWHFDSTTNTYASDPSETLRTRKVMRNHVLAAATDKHPAQVQVFTEDEVVGTWKTIKFSGALPAKRIQEMLVKVEELQKAVKFAREEANTTLAKDVKIGKAILDYVIR